MRRLGRVLLFDVARLIHKCRHTDLLIGEAHFMETFKQWEGHADVRKENDSESCITLNAVDVREGI
jgi:hypothetical protein